MHRSPRVNVGLLVSILVAISAPSGTRAFSFTFDTAPTQCGNMTIRWGDGRSPYSLLLVPTGHLEPETRTILQQDIPDGNEVSFVLGYPAQSQFVALMNDASGIGSGGTSAVMTVGSSSDSSCLNTQQVFPKFDFFQSPTNVTQCGLVNLSWQSVATTPVDILALIPGGQSFLIANITNGTRSIEWQAGIQAGTEMLFVAGDESGLGSGGSTDVMSVGEGNSTCFSGSSSSSTDISAHGSTPTSMTGEAGATGSSSAVPGAPSSTSSSHTSKHNVGLIVGLVLGVLTAVLACACPLYFVARRRKNLNHPGEYRDIDSGASRPRPLNSPRRAFLAIQPTSWIPCVPGDDLRREMYQADPFIVPASTSSFGTFASSGILDPPAPVHSVYRSSKFASASGSPSRAVGDQGFLGSFQQLDYTFAMGSSETLAIVEDDGHAFGGRRDPHVDSVIAKGVQGGPSGGLRLATQDLASEESRDSSRSTRPLDHAVESDVTATATLDSSVTHIDH